MNQSNPALPTHDEIALHAFLIWEKEGRQPGREQTHWLQAEAQLRLTRQQQAEAAVKAALIWPPQSDSAPKLASARAVTTSAPKVPRLAASRPRAGKPSSSKPTRSVARSSRKALVRN